MKLTGEPAGAVCCRSATSSRQGVNEARWTAMLDDAGYPKSAPRRLATRPPRPHPPRRRLAPGRCRAGRRLRRATAVRVAARARCRGGIRRALLPPADTRTHCRQNDLMSLFRSLRRKKSRNDEMNLPSRIAMSYSHAPSFPLNEPDEEVGFTGLLIFPDGSRHLSSHRSRPCAQALCHGPRGRGRCL